MSTQKGEKDAANAAAGKPFELEPLSVAIRRFSVFDSDSDDDESEHADSSSSSETDHSTGSDASKSDESERGLRHAAERNSDGDSSRGAVSTAPRPSTPPGQPTAHAAATTSNEAQHTVETPDATPETAAPLVSRAQTRLAQDVLAPTEQVTQPTATDAVIPPSEPILVAQPVARRQPVTSGGRKTIYERGLLQQRATEERMEELRASLATRDLDEATFQPTISPMARRLRRSPEAMLHQQRDRELLRRRLQVLEAPKEEDAEELTFHPQISERSARIIRDCRSAQPNLLPAGERLYLDHAYREHTAAEEVHVASADTRTIQRSASQIADHIATLYAFEQRKQEAVVAVRESERAGPTQTLYVDPAEVVKRLTQPRPSANAGTGALIHVGSANGPASPAACLSSGALGAPPLPPVTVVNEEMTALARSRGLMRWFTYFADHEPTLSMHSLLEYQGLHEDVARIVSGALLRTDVARSEWTPEAFLAALEPSNSFFWRTRPVTASEQEREMTFRPQINPQSERLVAAAAATADRKGATHDRLFTEARLHQLQQQQAELEAQRERLAEAEKENQRRAKREGQWRRQSRNTLHAAAAATTTTTTAVAVSTAPVVGAVDEAATKRDSQSCRASARAACAPVPVVAISAAGSETREDRPRKAAKHRAQRRGGSSPKLNTRASACHPQPTSSTSLQLAFNELQSILDELPAPLPGTVGGDTGERSLTPLSIHSEHEEEAESRYSHSAASATDSSGTTRRRHNAEHGKHSLDFLLACADCRQLPTVRSSERQLLEQENRRRLRRLGMQLYDLQW